MCPIPDPNFKGVTLEGFARFELAEVQVDRSVRALRRLCGRSFD